MRHQFGGPEPDNYPMQERIARERFGSPGAESKKLRDALRPFADIAADYRRRRSELDHSTLVQVTLGACLKAEMALMDDNQTKDLLL